MNPLVNRSNQHHSRSGSTTLRLVVSFLFVSSLMLPVPLVMAQAEEPPDKMTEAGLGAASALLTIPYGVTKIVYAGLGGIVGGFTWALTGGNTEVAEEVWEPSFYGTYVITPDHLRGNEPVRFFGKPPYEDTYEDTYIDE